jgi:hypothetical protein
MNDDMYLIPANSKRGALIFNVFRYEDLILFGSGIAFTIILLLILPTDNLLTTIIILLPVGISAILVAPIPNYHNVLVVLTSMLRFYSNRQKFIWKGWCVHEYFGDRK